MEQALIAGLAAVVVALIGGPVMWFLSRFDRRNTEQHAQNQAVLQEISKKVDGVQDDVSDVKSSLVDHLSWHLDRDGG